MLLFPQLGPQYYEEKHRDILSRMETAYAQSITLNQSYWSEASIFGLIKSSLIDLELLTGNAEDNRAECESCRERLNEKTRMNSGCDSLNSMETWRGISEEGTPPNK